MIKPRIPRTIRLSGKRYRVILEAPLDYDAGPGNQAQGLHSSWETKIWIDETLSHDQMRAIVVHEIVHGLDNLAGTEMTERDVTSFASVLFAALRDNPALVKWLMS